MVGGLTCNACNKEFDDDEQHKIHYKSEWHRCNLKRKVAGVPGVTEVLFQARQSALAEEQKKRERETAARSPIPRHRKELKMGNHDDMMTSSLLGSMWRFFCKCLFCVLSIGPMPNHIAFIMDGNRRFAKTGRNKKGTGHTAGFTALVSILQYCHEMGVKYVTVYAFSIDNFNRKPNEVQSVMNLLQEKIAELLREESIINKYSIKMNFWGNLDLLSEPVRLAVKEAMERTARNTGPVFSVCVAYTSTNEIVHAAQESIMKGHENGYGNDAITREDTGSIVSVADLDKHMFTRDCPEPDIVIRTSGETRLSNFLLWQTAFSHLQSPGVLWPEFSLRHLVWAILEYQKVYPHLEKIRRSNGKKT